MLGDNESQAVIRASEIAEYAYCRRAWWLRRVCGREPDNTAALREGLASHVRHGRSVANGLRWQRAGQILVGIGILASIWVLWLASGSGL